MFGMLSNIFNSIWASVNGIFGLCKKVFPNGYNYNQWITSGSWSGTGDHELYDFTGTTLVLNNMHFCFDAIGAASTVTFLVFISRDVSGAAHYLLRTRVPAGEIRNIHLNFPVPIIYAETLDIDINVAVAGGIATWAFWGDAIT